MRATDNEREAMSRKLDFEKEQERQRVKKQGSESSYEGGMTEKQKEALREGKEKDLKAARRRTEANRKSLAYNLAPTAKDEVERQLRGLEGIWAEMPASDRANNAGWFKSKKLSLEEKLNGGKSPKPYAMKILQKK